MCEGNGIGSAVSDDGDTQRVGSRRRRPDIKSIGFAAMNVVGFQRLCDSGRDPLVETMKGLTAREPIPMFIKWAARRGTKVRIDLGL